MTARRAWWIAAPSPAPVDLLQAALQPLGGAHHLAAHQLAEQIAPRAATEAHLAGVDAQPFLQLRGERRELLAQPLAHRVVAAAAALLEAVHQPVQAAALRLVQRTALRLQPLDGDLGVAARPGAAGQVGEAAAMAPAQRALERLAVGADDAAQPAQRDAEIVQRLRVAVILQPRRGLLGAGQQGEGDEADGLLRRAGEQ